MKGLNNKKDIDQDYISLQDAARFCSYSQDYLSLRARQGKLKAAKFGRNWVTTKDWLRDYLKTIGDYNIIHVNDKKLKKKLKVKAKIKRKAKPKAKVKKHVQRFAPPANLPIAKRSDFLKKSIFKNLKLGTLRPAFAAALALVLIIIGGVYSKESFIKIYNGLTPIVEEVNENFETNIVRGLKTINQEVAYVGLAGDFMIGDAVQSVNKVSQDIKTVSNIFQSNLAETENDIFIASVNFQRNIKPAKGLLKEYFSWIQELLKEI